MDRFGSHEANRKPNRTGRLCYMVIQIHPKKFSFFWISVFSVRFLDFFWIGLDLNTPSRGVRGPVWIGFETKYHPIQKYIKHTVWFDFWMTTRKIQSNPIQFIRFTSVRLNRFYSVFKPTLFRNLKRIYFNTSYNYATNVYWDNI